MRPERPQRLRRLLTMLCMVATCLFCAQVTIVQLDRIEHSLGLDHEANGLAGASALLGDYAHDTLPDDPSHPVSHAHVGDGGTQNLSWVASLSARIHYSTFAFAINDPPALQGEDRSVLERPPNV